LTAPALSCNLVECLALVVVRFTAGKLLPSLDRCIDVPRVQLDAVTASAGALSSENRREAAQTIIGIAQREGILTPQQEETIDNLSDTDRAIMEDAMKPLAPANDARAFPAKGETDAA
jgi:hypothetical protein